MAAPRVLTFNFHEPYLCLMAKTGYPFSIGYYDDTTVTRPWNSAFREPPRLAVFKQESEWRRELAVGGFDVVVAHNEGNAADVASACIDSGTPLVLAIHNRARYVRSTLESEDDAAAFPMVIERLREIAEFVFISESKRDDYGIPGTIILPGIDVDDFGGYTGETPEVLRVGNMMRERNAMFDVDLQERVCEGFPHRVAGANPTMAHSAPAASFEELQGLYRDRRCLLHVTREEWEDGYNLSMIEAMASGMPVVSLANRTSPLTDGVDGFVSCDVHVLRRHLKALLEDRDFARRIGERGRETVAKEFPMGCFVDNWRAVLDDAARRGPQRTRPQRDEVCSEESAPKPDDESQESAIAAQNILLHYNGAPHDAGLLFEDALRKDHHVITVGRGLSPNALPPRASVSPPPVCAPPDIELADDFTYAALADRLPDNLRLDLYIWVESDGLPIGPDIENLDAWKVCYLTGRHLDASGRVDAARKFDFVFVSQQSFEGQLAQAGVRNAAWLPPACADRFVWPEAKDRPYDVAFFPDVLPASGVRCQALCDRLAERFPNGLFGAHWPDEACDGYAQSKIAVCAGSSEAVPQCAFDAMASGALLISDATDLCSLAQDGVHFVLCANEDDLPETIGRYLADDDARERIGAAGRALTFERHMHHQRVNRLVFQILESLGCLGGGSGEARYNFGGYFRSPRQDLLPHVPEQAKRVLDVGCGGGEFGRLLKLRQGKTVAGIELNERAAEMARQVLDDVVQGNLEQMDLPFKEGSFDCIVCGDVLEHLVNPWAVLKKLARFLAPDGIFIISLPNIGFFDIVANLARGRWDYADAGILDRTHLRFFTRPVIRGMVEGAGLAIETLKPLCLIGPENVPLDAEGYVNLPHMRIGPVAEEQYQDLLTFQFLVRARKPEGDYLSVAAQAFAEGDYERAQRLAESSVTENEWERKRIVAKAKARMGQADDAEALFREILHGNPNDTEATVNLGILLLAVRRPDEAKPLLERARRDAPENNRVIGALGLLALLEDNKEEAFDLFKQSLDIEFDNEMLHVHLLQTAFELNRLEEAEPYLRRYIEFYPGNIEMTCQYASMLHTFGKRKEALEHLDQVLLFSPGHTEANRLRTSIIEQSP